MLLIKDTITTTYMCGLICRSHFYFGHCHTSVHYLSDEESDCYSTDLPCIIIHSECIEIFDYRIPYQSFEQLMNTVLHIRKQWRKICRAVILLHGIQKRSIPCAVRTNLIDWDDWCKCMCHYHFEKMCDWCDGTRLLTSAE